MKWYERFFRKQSATAMAVVNLPNAIPTPRNYESFSKEAYQKNVVAFRAIHTISSSCGQIPWELFKGEKEIKEHELLKLLQRPNPLQAQSAFIEAVISYYLISGNTYIEAVGPTKGVLSKVKELYVLPPNLMSIKPGSGNFPSAYTFTLPGRTVDFHVDTITMKSAILHMKTFHPLNAWYGMSPIEAAALALDQHNESSMWNLSLLQNKCVPSSAFTVEPSVQNPFGTLDNEEYQRVKQEIAERYSGSQNAGRPVVLTGGLKYQQMGFSPEDMNWINGKNSTAREVALALGMPPMLLGIQGDNTYSNQKEARLALYEETIIPLMCDLQDELNNWLTPVFGDGLKLQFNVDSLPVMEVKHEMKWNRVKEVDFLTYNEKREAIGYEKINDPMADQILVPFSITPLSDLGRVDETEEEIEEEADEENDEEEVDESEKSLIYKANLNRFESARKSWIKQHAGEMIQGLSNRTRAGILKTVRREVLDHVNEPIGVMAKAIQLSLGNSPEFSRARAMRIARTETTIASSKGSLAAAEALGIPNMLKEWISGPDDDRARDFHQPMDGKTVELKENFVVPNPGGSPDDMSGPGDDTAPPEQIINCRCVLGYTVDEKAFNMKDPIDKKKRWREINHLRSKDFMRMSSQVYSILKIVQQDIIESIEGVTDVRMVELMIDNGMKLFEKSLGKVIESNLDITMKRFGQEIFDAAQKR